MLIASCNTSTHERGFNEHRRRRPGWRRPARSLLSGLFLLAGLLLSLSVQAKGPMSLEERVACQATLEDIRWSETIWPEQNPEPKPDRQHLLGDAQLREKVEEQLRQEAVLAADYGQRIDAASLQRELDRMATFTRASDRLAKRFEALGHDANRIAECIARPQLVQQRLRATYANSMNQHDTLRQKAEAALASGAGTKVIEASGGSEQIRVLIRRDDDVESSKSASLVMDGVANVIELDADDYDNARMRLTSSDKTFDLPGLPPRAQPLLRETDHFFVQETLLWESADRLEVRVRSWPKRSFDDWWAERRQHVAGIEAAPAKDLILPTIRDQVIDLRKAAADSWELRSFSTPSARYGHSVVWTGSEMIVWGGSIDDGNVTDTGGRYDPATDTWSAATSTSNAPSPRYLHSAVWTGSVMIVWGGLDDNFSPLNSGGRYDPSTDSWGAATSGGPSPRYLHSAVWSGSEMVVWGGYDSGSNPLNTGERYIPATNSWGAPTATSGAPDARAGQGAVWTGSEMIVWGGLDGSNTNTGGRYDPVTNTWGAPTTTTNAPSARRFHSAVWTGSEMIVWGGLDGSNTNTGGRYDPLTNTWGAPTTTTNAPSARRFHSAVWTGAEMIVWGGLDGSNTNTGGRYDPANDSWGPATNNASGAPEARHLHSAVWTGSEMIVWGGEGVGVNNEFNTGGRYDPATDNWGEPPATTDAPSARIGHSAVWTGSEMIVWGGSTAAVVGDTGGRYDPTTNTWGPPTNTTNAPGERRFHSAVWTGSEMIVWGGNNATNTGGRYNPATDTWGNATETDSAPSGRYLHSAVWTGSEMIVWGGNDSIFSSANTGGRYDPANDSWGAPTATSGAPGQRNSHSAVWTGSEMIVWGGFADGGSNPFNTGGRYDPATNSWGDATDASGAPSARLSHSAIWTGSEMIVWGGSRGIFDEGLLNAMALYFPYDVVLPDDLFADGFED